jgi:putative ATP-dependent endonuclease of OLD family
LYSQLSNINGQKIISTHSPFITGQCALENLRHFYKGAENPQVSQLNLQGTSPEDIRKLRREIMHSRGELLYSKTIVLFEGETEEQALPIFAKAFWNKYPFELGINFVGVGGSGKYLPFIRFCIAFKIPWFILSDGEASAIRDITSALNSVGKKMEECTENLTIIPNGSDFEKHLLETGYQEEVKNSKISILEGILKSEDFKSPQEKEAKEKKFEDDKNKIATLTDADLENFMDKNKTAFSPVISEIIVKLSDKKRRFPPIVKELLDKIANKIGVEIHKDNL